MKRELKGKYPNRLRQILEERGMNQADLCRATGLNPSLVSNYVTEQVSPTLEHAVIIADALKVSLDELIGRTSHCELSDEEKEVLRKFFRSWFEALKRQR